MNYIMDRWGAKDDLATSSLPFVDKLYTCVR